jgi:hypothetical protein
VIAAPYPWFAWEITTAPASRATFAVLSVEPSSHTITLSTWGNDFATISSIVFSSLYAGMQANFNVIIYQNFHYVNSLIAVSANVWVLNRKQRIVNLDCDYC